MDYLFRKMFEMKSSFNNKFNNGFRTEHNLFYLLKELDDVYVYFEENDNKGGKKIIEHIKHDRKGARTLITNKYRKWLNTDIGHVLCNSVNRYQNSKIAISFDKR